MREFLRSAFACLHRLLPKRHHAVVYGWPDGEDQSRALEQALQQTTLERVVLLLDQPQQAPWADGHKTLRCRKNSIAGICWFLTARYAFFSHPCFVRQFPDSVVSVNLWHGMPIKKIGAMIDHDEPIRCSHTLATSPFWGEIMRQTIMKPGGDVLTTGLPRTDRLFTPAESVIGRLGLEAGSKILVWLPTYRTSSRGLPRQDGIDHGNAFGMPDLNPAILNEFLARHDALMLVKPHPMAATAESTDLSHLRIIDDAWLAAHQLSLYELLAASSLLITDISSVYIDYLLLDRPVVHAFPDRDAYGDSRGFTVDNLDEWFAGPVVTNMEEWMAAVGDELSGSDPHAARRKKILETSHLHRDGASTQRLLQSIGLSP